MPDEMRFAASLSYSTDPLEAANEIVRGLQIQLGTAKPDLVLAFFCGYAPQAASSLAEALTASIDARVMLGCTAESIIGQELEIENQTAVSVVAATLPGVELSPFAISADNWPELLADHNIVRERLGLSSDPKLFILLADPVSSPIDEALEVLNYVFPKIPIIGGMASAANAGGPSAKDVLFLKSDAVTITNSGAVGLAISGAVEVDVIVSQGCRPIGRLFTITAAQQNILLSLEDQPPMPLLQQLFEDLPDEDRELIRNGVYIGRAIESGQDELGRGDFLIRGVMGADPERGFIAVGDFVNPGERVQFHLRDAVTATEDLEMLLLPQTLQDKPAGAFLFSCNGRGRRLYDYPNGDISVVQNALGNVPIAGFFCAGEIGPVGGRNFLHGQTASMVIFRPSK